MRMIERLLERLFKPSIDNVKIRIRPCPTQVLLNHPYPYYEFEGIIYLGVWDGEISIETVVSIISHEYIHHILLSEHNSEVSQSYDKVYKEIEGVHARTKLVDYSDRTSKLIDCGMGGN